MIFWNHCFSQNMNKKLSRFLPSLHRAKILTIFCLYFESTDDFINSFWNCLTFTNNCRFPISHKAVKAQIRGSRLCQPHLLFAPQIFKPTYDTESFTALDSDPGSRTRSKFDLLFWENICLMPSRNYVQ